jgi:transcriptional antiterminator NusG
MSEIEKKWYVLRAISGKEAKVKEYLEADIKNSDLGDYVSQVLIPTEKVYQVRNGKKIVKERSYLPGYVLVEAALVGEVAHHLRNTPNVIGFLGGSEKPVPLRQSEVNRILGTVDELQDAGEARLLWNSYIRDRPNSTIPTIAAVNRREGYAGYLCPIHSTRLQRVH